MFIQLLMMTLLAHVNRVNMFFFVRFYPRGKVMKDDDGKQ